MPRSATRRVPPPLALLACALAAASARGAEIAKGPYLQRPSRTGVTIRFELDAPEEAAVRYGEGEKLDRSVRVRPFQEIQYDTGSGRQTRKTKGHLYRVRLADLKPGTRHSYAVEVGGARGEARSFTTLPEKAEAVTFIAYGDNRSYPGRHRSVLEKFAQHEPAFILHSGDCIGTPKEGGADRWGEQFFGPLAAVADRIPMWVAKGNHDDKGGLFEPLFVPEGGRTWYSFDYGNLHVAVLDSTLEDEKERAEMLAWFKRDIAASPPAGAASGAAWKVVVAHHPFYNAGGYGYAWGREDYVPLFHRHGVDLVFTGHAHLYERFVPMSSKDSPERPVTYVIAAGGGAPLYAPAEHPYLAATKPVLHYVVVRAEGESIQLRVLTPEGDPIDTLSWTKKNGVPDAAYRKLARPREEWIQPEGTPRKEPLTLRQWQQEQRKKR